VWPDRSVHDGAAGDAAHNPGRTVPVHALAVGTKEYRPVEAFPGGQIDRACGPWGQGDDADLAALAQHGQSAVAAFDAEGVDASAGGLPIFAAR
jgi:hypothetical protein